MALRSLSLSFSLVEYSGRSSTLKQVWEVGNLTIGGEEERITFEKTLQIYCCRDLYRCTMSFTCAKSVVKCIFECWLIENVIHHCNLHDYTSWCFKKKKHTKKQVYLIWSQELFFNKKNNNNNNFRTIKITALWHYFQEKYPRSCFFFSIPMLTFFNVKNVFWFKIESIWYMIYLKPELIIEQ